MGSPNILFVFQQASQWVALTGSRPGSGLCTPNVVVLNDGGGDISVPTPSNGNFTYKGTSYPTYPTATCTLVVGSQKTPKFSFTATDATASATAYFLTGVALKNAAATGGNGGQSFPGLKVDVDNQTNATTLTLQDNNKGAATYDFWVMAQNSAGDVGLIDPLISNTN